MIADVERWRALRDNEEVRAASTSCGGWPRTTAPTAT